MTDKEETINEIQNRVSGLTSAKRYNFGLGLHRDLMATRRVLEICSEYHHHHDDDDDDDDEPQSYTFCTFDRIFHESQGQIANLNRVLQNMRRVGEISFRPECFFVGQEDQTILLLDPFWQSVSTSSSSSSFTTSTINTKAVYRVDQSNLFRAKIDLAHEMARIEQACRGRSYEAENRATRNQHECHVCGQWVEEGSSRLTIRGRVFHSRCIRCVQCKATLHQRMDYMTFDGEMCCSLSCLQAYNGAHIRQVRVVSSPALDDN